VYATETAVVNTKMVTRRRFNYAHETSSTSPLSLAPAIVVTDALTAALHGRQLLDDRQLPGNQQRHDVQQGAHTFKWARGRAPKFDSYAPSNFNGTFAFVGNLAESESAFQQYQGALQGLAGSQPTTFTKAFGTPLRPSPRPTSASSCSTTGGCGRPSR